VGVTRVGAPGAVAARASVRVRVSALGFRQACHSRPGQQGQVFGISICERVARVRWPWRIRRRHRDREPGSPQWWVSAGPALDPQATRIPENPGLRGVFEGILYKYGWPFLFRASVSGLVDHW